MINNNLTTTGNTGEWSELYVLAFLLANGGVYGADKNQNRKLDLYYKVLKIIFSNNKNTTYEVDGNLIKIFIDGKKTNSIKAESVQKLLNVMLQDLISKNDGRAFTLESGSEMMKILQKETIKASSKNKNDLDLVLVDIKSGLPSPEIGFSIKSQLGSPSTLVNASMATNFTYEILDNEMNPPKFLPTLSDKMVKDNICLLLDNGLNLVFQDVDSLRFKKNLSLIDSNLSLYLSKLLLSYYSRGGNNFSDLVSTNFSDIDSQNVQPIHKIKEFLSIMALGMMPDTDWNGILTSLGGFLLVKRDGDVLCFYIYNLEDFQMYLLNNTKLETPSTTRYGIGKIIEKDGRYFIKLNLQIRFRK